jgi:hypothetical protein
VKSRVTRESGREQVLRGGHLYAIALIAASALFLVPAGASAASPVLELVVPGHSLPIGFTTEGGAVTAEMAGFESLVHCAASNGEGEITGPRSTVSKYRLTGCVTERGSTQKCKSTGANEEEIRTGPIEGELVYIDQARHQVGILLNPGGGIYLSFECGGESAGARGSFLAPVGPINQEATSFTATLNQLDSVQTPDTYENENDELLQAIPTGRKGSAKFVPTGVEMAVTVHPSAAGEIKAVTAQEVETQKLEEAVKKAEEHAKQVGEEAAVELAAARREPEVIGKVKSPPLTRAQLLLRALRECEKQPKKRRARCVASARRRYGAKTKKRGRR